MTNFYKPSVMLRVALLLLVAFGCASQQLSAAENLVEYTQEELEILGSRLAENGRSYRYPSIMIEHDFHVSKEIKGWNYASLKSSLVDDGWDLIMDSKGHMYKIISPEITYEDLRSSLNFYDQDVTLNYERKIGEPHAYITTEWSNCEITYLGETYDGNDVNVKLTAVVFDNEDYEQHLKYNKMEEETGWMGMVLKYIYWFSK